MTSKAKTKYGDSGLRPERRRGWKEAHSRGWVGWLCEEGWGLVKALKAGYEAFGEGFSGLVPEEAAGNAAVFFDGESEGQE